MKTTLAVTTALLATWLSACAPRRQPHTCGNVVPDAADSLRAFVSQDTVYTVAAKGDTLPKPHFKCVTIYAQTKDTLPKP